MKNTKLTSNKSKGKKKHTNIFIRILKSPIIALLKVSEMYTNSMSSCAHEFDQNAVANFNFVPQVVVATARDPKRQEDLDELIRAVSKKLNVGNIEIKEAVRAEQQRAGPPMEMSSYSVGIGTIGRIDEDAPCEFKNFRLC